jgi:hypothetical protein
MIPNEMTGSHPQLTADDVRNIVREELQKENDNG